MRSVLSVVFVASLAAAFVGASAQTTPVTPTPTAPATTEAAPATTPANNDDVVSCRYEKKIGSLFSTRICHTQREWHQMNVDARDTVGKMDDEGSRRDTTGLGGGN